MNGPSNPALQKLMQNPEYAAKINTAFNNHKPVVILKKDGKVIMTIKEIGVSLTPEQSKSSEYVETVEL